MWQDVRFAFRMLAKSPAFTVVAVLTLALGIGANTAIFSMADAFLVRPISLPGVDRLAIVSGYQKAPASAADYLDWKAQSRSFEQLAAYRQDDINLTGAGQPERVVGSYVTPDFFATVGVAPLIGRAFSANEGMPRGDQVVILSQGLWKQHFSGDPGVLGKTVDLNGQSCTIVGVMPGDFDFPVPSDLWRPLAFTPAERADRATRALNAMGRLRSGVSFVQAQAEMSTIGRRLAQSYPVADKDLTVRVMPISEFVEGDITRSYTFMLLIVAGVVLLIACSNLANLQLARSTARQREVAVRTALGASRWRIVRLLLVENLMMGVLGGAVSIALAGWTLNQMGSSMPADIARLIPGWYEIRVDGRVLLFTLAVAILSGVIAGLMPALNASRTALNESLKAGPGAGGSPARQRMRSAFVVVQIVVALVLVVSAALMVKGFGKLAQTQESYAPEHMLVMAVNLPASRYATESARELFYRQALRKLRAMPEVTDAETFYTIPLSNDGSDWHDFQIEGSAPPARGRGRGPAAVLQTISAGYFSMLNIPVQQGRAFSDADQAGSQRVAIVSQKLANYYWPHESALGQHIRLGGAESRGPWLTIVGVASNVLYDWTDQLPEPAIYVPYEQAPLAATVLAIRTNTDAVGLAQSARAALASIDPQSPAFNVMPLANAIRESIVGLADVAGMMAAIGLIALVIALVGVYGVLAYFVAGRTHEFGVRMALGALPRDILRLLLWRGASLAGVGMIIGLPLAVVVARLLAGLIYGTSSMDWGVFAGIAALLLGVICAACLVPARRAMRVDPMVALRYE